MRNRLTAVLHPVQAWRAYTAAVERPRRRRSGRGRAHRRRPRPRGAALPRPGTGPARRPPRPPRRRPVRRGTERRRRTVGRHCRSGRRGGSVVDADTQPRGVVTVSAARVGACLDCAAVLHLDDATGALVDQWGQATCGASCRAHAADFARCPLGRLRRRQARRTACGGLCRPRWGRGGRRGDCPASRTLRAAFGGPPTERAAP